MSDLQSGLQRVRTIGDQPGGIARLAEESGLPYSSVHSFARRGWRHRSLDFLVRLSQAAERITARQTEA
jgi:hypothetical protein